MRPPLSVRSSLQVTHRGMPEVFEPPTPKPGLLRLRWFREDQLSLIRAALRFGRLRGFIRPFPDCTHARQRQQAEPSLTGQ